MARRGDRFGTIKLEGSLRVFLRRFEKSWGKKKRERNGFSSASVQSSRRHRMIANVRWASCFPLPSCQRKKQRKRKRTPSRVIELTATFLLPAPPRDKKRCRNERKCLPGQCAIIVIVFGWKLVGSLVESLLINHF